MTYYCFDGTNIGVWAGHVPAMRGLWMGGSPCRMSIIRDGNVALPILRKDCGALSTLRNGCVALSNLRKGHVACR